MVLDLKSKKDSPNTWNLFTVYLLQVALYVERKFYVTCNSLIFRFHIHKSIFPNAVFTANRFQVRGTDSAWPLEGTRVLLVCPLKRLPPQGQTHEPAGFPSICSVNLLIVLIRKRRKRRRSDTSMELWDSCPRRDSYPGGVHRTCTHVSSGPQQGASTSFSLCL